MPKQEVLTFVKDNFFQQERQNGYTDVHAVADSLVGNSHDHQKAERTILRMQTKDHLYDGASDTLKDLLEPDNHVIIWTQGDKRGQLWKAVNAGLYSLRQELPYEEKKRFSVIAEMDKITPLPSIFKSLQNEKAKNFFIVDDKSNNIKELDERIERWKKTGEIPEDTDIQLIWINQGRTKDQVPEGFTAESFSQRYTTINDIRQLEEIKPEDKKAVWFIDLDHTILDTSNAREKMFEMLADQIEPTHPVISPSIDLKLRLNGNVRAVEDLKSGMSGGRVARIETDQGTIVVKYNPEEPHKISGEVRGYRALQETPLSPYLLRPFFASEADGVLAMPYFDGIQLREGIKSGELSTTDALKVVSELLSVKKDFWSCQPKIYRNGELVSMQRKEWPDTLEKISQVVASLSERFNIPTVNLWISSLVVEGQEYPSLVTLLGQVHDFLHQSPPYAVLTHGDATGANTLYDPRTKTWRIFDTEWTGYSDSSEAFVRTTKYISTTTVQAEKPIQVSLSDGRLHINLNTTHSATASMLQEYGMSMVDVFAYSLRDPDFSRRVKYYLSGSYLREFALSAKRGNPELGLFALVKAGEALMK